MSITPLDSPFKLLAGDVNSSDSLSTADILLIRRLVLAITTNFPSGLWRFVRADYQFADPQAPWGAIGVRNYTNLIGDINGQDFLAIKFGDVNNSWTAPMGLQPLPQTSEKAFNNSVSKPSFFAPAPPLAGANGDPPVVNFQAGNLSLGPTATGKVAITVSGFSQVASVQFTLQWDPAVLRFRGVGDFGLTDLANNNFGTTLATNGGKLMLSWENPDGVTLADGTAIFAVSFLALGGSGSDVAIVDTPLPREIMLNSGADVIQGLFVSQNGRVSITNNLIAPAITTQPQSASVAVGSAISLSVSATGSAPLFYQWQKNGSTRSGATNALLLLSDVQISDSGSYSVVVSNTAGSITSAPAILTVLWPPRLGLRMTETGATVAISGTIGQNYTLQYLQDFEATNHWLPLTNFTLTNGDQSWLDLQSTNYPRRFYRAVTP